MLPQFEPQTLGRLVAVLAYIEITLTVAIGMSFIDFGKLGSLVCFQAIGIFEKVSEKGQSVTVNFD